MRQGGRRGKSHKSKKKTHASKDKDSDDDKEKGDTTGLGELIDKALNSGDDEGSDENGEEGDVITAKMTWEGTWFGCLVFGDCTGKFANSSGSTYANYLVLNFEDDNTGNFTINNSWNEYGSGKFEIVDDQLYMTEGTVFDSPLNTDNWQFENMDSYGRKILMEDKITDVDGDVLEFFIWLKPWGSDWSEMQQTELYADIFKPYEDRISGGQNPPYDFKNDYINSPDYDIAAGKPSGTTSGSDKDDDSDNDKKKDDGDSASGGVDVPAVEAKNYTVVDNEYVKIVVVDKGVYEYNDSWIGYNLLITNKCDCSIDVYSQKDDNDDPNLGGGSDECFYKGKVTKTHFWASIDKGVKDYDITLAIDGITDVKDVEDVSGYFHVTGKNNINEFYPYHFK